MSPVLLEGFYALRPGERLCLSTIIETTVFSTPVNGDHGATVRYRLRGHALGPGADCDCDDRQIVDGEPEVT